GARLTLMTFARTTSLPSNTLFVNGVLANNTTTLSLPRRSACGSWINTLTQSCAICSTGCTAPFETLRTTSTTPHSSVTTRDDDLGRKIERSVLLETVLATVSKPRVRVQPLDQAAAAR